MSEERAEYRVNRPPGAQTDIPAATLQLYGEPDYRPPNPDEIREALRRGGLTGSRAGELLGVNGRTIRKWTGGEQTMPYSAWRLLLIYIGLAEPVRMDADPNRPPGAMVYRNGGSIADRIVALVRDKPGLTEREIAEELFGPKATQQRVNQDCRLLVDRGVLRRNGYGGPADPYVYELASE